MVRDLPVLAALSERSENVKQAGLRVRLRLYSWLWVGLLALLSTLSPPERLENVERAVSRKISPPCSHITLGKC